MKWERRVRQEVGMTGVILRESRADTWANSSILKRVMVQNGGICRQSEGGKPDNNSTWGERKNKLGQEPSVLYYFNRLRLFLGKVERDPRRETTHCIVVES